MDIRDDGVLVILQTRVSGDVMEGLDLAEASAWEIVPVNSR